MFILKRQDVEISSIPHPQKDQKIPILHYQGQTFRLISVFSAAQEEDARAFWRDLTDNRGKACVLLEEPERYSVWGKIRIGQEDGGQSDDGMDDLFIQAGVLLLQAMYVDIEDLLGAKQAKAFESEITVVFQQWRFPEADSTAAIGRLLDMDPLAGGALPPWQEHHLNTLMQELYRLGKTYFGNTSFTERVLDSLQDLSSQGRQQFLAWLQQSPTGKLWTQP